MSALNEDECVMLAILLDRAIRSVQFRLEVEHGEDGALIGTGSDVWAVSVCGDLVCVQVEGADVDYLFAGAYADMEGKRRVKQ